MKQKKNCLAIMTIVMFGGKRGRLASQRTPSHPWSTGVAAPCCGVLCCRRDWCTSQNRCHHEDGKLCGYIEATSQDISQEVKAWSQMGLPNGHWPQAYFQSCGKMAWGQQNQGNGVAITKPWPQFYRKCVGRTEKAGASKEAYKPDSVTPALSGRMGQNVLWDACGRLPETFDLS